MALVSCEILSGIYKTMVFLDSVNERHDAEGKIEIFIDNKTNETLIIFVNGFKKGAELSRILQGKEQRIKITKGRTIYISGGNTGKDYCEIICDDDGETFTIL
jgi:hypothetical protein